MLCNSKNVLTMHKITQQPIVKMRIVNNANKADHEYRVVLFIQCDVPEIVDLTTKVEKLNLFVTLSKAFYKFHNCFLRTTHQHNRTSCVNTIFQSAPILL